MTRQILTMQNKQANPRDGSVVPHRKVRTNNKNKPQLEHQLLRLFMNGQISENKFRNALRQLKDTREALKTAEKDVEYLIQEAIMNRRFS